MNILDNKSRTEAVQVSFSGPNMWVWLKDDSQIIIPIDDFPRLHNATQDQLNNWRLIGRGRGINWPDLDEDISIAGLLQGSHERADFLGVSKTPYYQETLPGKSEPNTTGS